MIVDDAPNNLLICKAALKNYQTLTATSGEEALALAVAEKPDLIILDIMMPGMSGFETAEHLRHNELLCDTPIIFLSALSDMSSKVTGFKLGATDYITKPLDVPILRLRVANVLERDHMRKQLISYNEQLEQSLSEQKILANTLESAFNVIHDSLLITNSQFIIQKVNANAERMFSSCTADLLNKDILEFSLSDLSGKAIALTDLIRLDTITEGKLTLPNAETLLVAISARAYNIKNDETNILFSILNISHRLELEARNRHTNKLLADMSLELNAQKDALDKHALVSITDSRGLITYVNEKFCEITGYLQAELIGKTHCIIKSDLHPPEFYTDIWQTITSGKTWKGEITNRKSNGELYWVNSTIVPWLDEHGKPDKYIAIRTEITDRIKAEQQVALARQREIDISSAIQQRLLFGTPPTNLAGFAIASFSEASQGIDGDFYTFTRVGPHSFEILTGDVMGKGIAAAMIGAGIKSSYRRLLIEHMANSKKASFPSPAELINAIHQEVTPDLIKFNTFVTLSLLRFDHAAMTLTVVNAGHTPAIQVSKNGLRLNKLEGDNLPIGVIENEVYQEQVFPMMIGDSIMLYSDGISESINPNGEYYGETRIASILQTGQQLGASSSILLQSLRSDIHDFTERPNGNDDRTAIVIQITPLRSQLRGKITDRNEPEYIDVPRQFKQLGHLRQRIAVLAQDQPEESVQALILAAFEAATNVIRHTPEKLRDAPFTAVLKRNQTELSVELVYAGQPFVQDAPPAPDFSGASDGGFGLFIIENSVDRVIYSRPMTGLASIRMIKKLQSAQVTATD
ncbi:SpoIIE family protein phosphatase [Propionivibrio sp.]|uniref:SpoIIE family protein phosphatase n=1 Tax=Propionivibrio sp. TaxID=2212460 RepID=UPI003BF3B882